jgi:Nucleoside-diphosphate-sugar epimerases
MKSLKKALVCGAGGFIGNHMVSSLKSSGYTVIGTDIRHPIFSDSEADEFIVSDLRNPNNLSTIFKYEYDEVYQLATDMGGAGYLFTGKNDANVMYNSSLINLNILNASKENGVKKIFYPSSACVYPNPKSDSLADAICHEHLAYPANPTSEYGWEKLFSERLYQTFSRSYNIKVKIARFHTIYGPGVAYKGGKEKVPAALARKVIEAKDNSYIEIWGDGEQLRTFLYIDDCIEAIHRLMASNSFHGPVNIGSDELITINYLARKYISFSDKNLDLKHVPGPEGVKARNSSNHLISQHLGWSPSTPLDKGLNELYLWISSQITNDISSVKPMS